MGKTPLRSKIALDNKSIKQVSHFRYLGCNTTCDVDCDVAHKLAKFQSVCGTIRRVSSKKTRKDTRLTLWLCHKG